ncbi:Bardet-Biedl syndrome 5 protein homolog [Chrysoperla carnea]|uniref:Bardet-Biedl syndrome 5 protein homolog n=1 Tax=Chrysoperla carnea TaxID=189513 RepID=UPI001D084F3D|nr:Bardet-Biedl syndrome 5 protein homolog [Chrysoperla carnea]
MVLFVDNEVRFDVPYSYMKLRPGEKIIDRLDSIEDTKGNGGDIGNMFITNLRILWYLLSATGVSLSIGFNCVVSTSTTLVNSHLKGKTEALHILTSYKNSKFEFIFTNLIPGNYRHFTSVMGVHKAYVLSKLYRELKLRGSVVQNKQLKILPSEQIYSNTAGVWNLSSDQGNLGTLIITNIRIVWFADINEAFNISLPYLQITSVKIQESKFGLTLVLTSHESSGGYVLGFKLDSVDKLQSIHKEINTLYQVYLNNPIYGVHYIWTKKTPPSQNETKPIDDLQELATDERNEISNTFTIYMTESNKNGQNLPKYYPQLGLSVENLKDGFTLKKLWEVIPQNN